jgi:thioredoxin 1
MEIAKKENFETLKNQDKVLLKCSAGWCVPCKQLKPTLTQIENVFPSIHQVEVDGEDLPEVFEQLGVMQVPTLIYFENGEEKGRKTGLIPKEKILELCGVA